MVLPQLVLYSPVGKAVAMAHDLVPSFLTRYRGDICNVSSSHSSHSIDSACRCAEFSVAMSAKVCHASLAVSSVMPGALGSCVLSC